jgi:hypothetical protein
MNDVLSVVKCCKKTGLKTAFEAFSALRDVALQHPLAIIHAAQQYRVRQGRNPGSKA